MAKPKKGLKHIEKMPKAPKVDQLFKASTWLRWVRVEGGHREYIPFILQEVRIERDFAAAKQEWLEKKEAARKEAEKKKEAAQRAKKWNNQLNHILERKPE